METDYESLEIPPPKPKRRQVTYGKRGQRSNSTSARPVLTPASPATKRPSLHRESSTDGLGAALRKRGRGEVQGEEADGESSGDSDSGEGQPSRPTKRARAPTTDSVLLNANALPHLDLLRPRSAPASKSIDSRTSDKRAKPSTRKKTTIPSPAKAKERDVISDLVRVGGEESGDNEEGKRLKKRGKLIPRVEDEDAQMDDATAPSTKAFSSQAPALSISNPQAPRQRSEPTPQIPILQHAVLGDKSNLPRPLQNARPPSATRPTPHPAPARARSTTAITTGELPRPVARHSSAGGSTSRRPLSRVSLASPRIPVFRDVLDATATLGAGEEDEDSPMIDLAALSSALPSPLPAILGSPLPSQRLPTPRFPSPRNSNHSNGDAEMRAQNELPRPVEQPNGGSAIPFASEMNSSFVLETFEEGSVEELFASLQAQGVLREPRVNPVEEEEFDVGDYLDLAAMDADDEDDTIILEHLRSTSHSLGPTSPSPQAPRTTFARPASSPADTSLDLPPRYLSPPLDPALSSGPPSDEDDLAYLLRTTSSRAVDERDWAASEREIGVGFAPGSRIRGGEGARRGVRRNEVLKRGSEIVCGEEEADELRMRW